MTHDQIVGLHHAQVTYPVGQEAAARDFYLEVLGLTEIPKPETLRGRGGFWVQLGNCDLHLSPEPDFDRTQTKAHLAYQVGDVMRWRERMQSAGLTVLDSIPIAGYVRFECRDPFGNRLEFIQAVNES